MTSRFPTAPLGDVLIPVSRPESVDPGKTYRILGAHWYAHGLYIKDVKPGSAIQADKVYQVKQDDFVYNRLFAWKGSFAIATTEDDGCYVSNEFPCFAIKRDHADPRYLWRYFGRAPAWDEALSLSTGGTPTSRNRLKEEQFLRMKIPLPPLDEQRRIVARIEELAAKIEEAGTHRHHAAEEAEALGKFRLSTFVDRDSVARPLRELCTQITDGEHATPPRIDERQVPLVTAKNVRDGYLDMRVTDFVSRETAEKCWKRCRPKDGDVLMVCVGATTGRVCHLVGPPDMVIVRSVAMLRCNQEALDPRYLEYALESLETQDQIWDQVKQAAQPCLYLNRIGNLSIPVPPLSQQQRIVAQLDALQTDVDALKHLQAETAAELDALLPSILDKAFKGEL